MQIQNSLSNYSHNYVLIATQFLLGWLSPEKCLGKYVKLLISEWGRGEWMCVSVWWCACM